MTQLDYTLQGVLVPDDTGYQTRDVHITAGKIAAIEPSLPILGEAIAGQNKLLLPGFVNAHTHSPEMWQRGLIPPRPLELWLAELYDFSPLDLGQIYYSALGTAVETLKSGGTTVVDHLILIPGHEVETVAAAARAYREVGVRAFIGPLIQDQAMTEGVPSGGIEREHDPYLRSTTDTLKIMQEIVDAFHRPEEGISIMVAPTGMQLCSDALFEGCIELSERHHLCRHTHLLETKAQQMLAHEKYGYSAVEHLKQLGFLGPMTSLAHTVWVDDADIALLAETQSTVVHNPLSNLRLGSGIAPVLKFRRAGVNVAFGCDGAASNDSQDLLEAVKIGTILHNTTDLDYRQWITPRQAIDIAARGGATGLGIASHIGALAVGHQADLVLYDLTNLSLLPRTDPIGLLVLGRPSQAVHSAWVNGVLVIHNGHCTRLDEDQLRQSLFAQSQWQVNRQSPSMAQLEDHYRLVMGLP